MWDPIRYIVELIYPHAAPDIVQSVGNLSLHRGYPFIFLAHQRIYNAIVWIMSVISVYHDALMRLAVCAIRRAFAFPSIEHSATHNNTQQHTSDLFRVLSATLSNTQQHTLTLRAHSAATLIGTLRDTLSVCLSLSLLYTYRRVFPKHLKKTFTLCASKQAG